MIAALSLLIAISSPASASITVFGTAPRIESQGPGFSYELGTIFTSSVAGEVIGVRFYMGPNEASNPGGDIVGKLWTGDGTLLASAKFANPTEGWNEVDFLSPVLIAAGTPYVVSANNNLVNGKNFSANEYPFNYPVASGPLTATAGTYISPAGLFPNNQTSNGASFYGRDVIFEPLQNTPVPEPTSLALWSVSAFAAAFGLRKRR